MAHSEVGSRSDTQAGAVGIGFQVVSDGRWISYPTPYPYTDTKHVYAMSGVLTVVPEPSTLALAAFGFVAFAAFGWRRKR